ncbi:MAG: phenylacetate-CoA ligase [Gammaproteobacteria bacterium]|jgi:phenylacetate-CoA ligase
MGSLVSTTPLRTAVSHLGWPLVPNVSTAIALTVQQQLQDSQWWSADAIRDKQLEQLRRVLRHAQQSVPFYRQQDAYADTFQAAYAGWDEWHRLPILEREDLQRAGTAINSTQVPADHGNTSLMVTTGSTGRPVRVLTTQVTALFWKAFTFRDHLWHNRDFAAKLGAIRALDDGVALPPAGAHQPSWGPATDLLVDTGPAVVLNLHCSIEKQLRWLQREQPHYLITYPTIAKALAIHCIETGAAIAGLRELRTIGEALPDDLRRLAQQAWNVPLTDMYTAQEVGYIAMQCPKHDHYHVQSENVLVEVLDDNGNPCNPGQSGRVVVTGLHNFATPLLRYAIGDYAEVGEPCDCGRGLPVLNRIHGRVRNMLRLPGGETRWPLIGHLVPGLERLPTLRQYQLVQKSLQLIEAQVVVPQPLSAAQEATLITMWQQSLGHPFDIRIVYVREIPRAAGGKYEEFRSEVL